MWQTQRIIRGVLHCYNKDEELKPSAEDLCSLWWLEFSLGWLTLEMRLGMAPRRVNDFAE